MRTKRIALRQVLYVSMRMVDCQTDLANLYVSSASNLLVSELFSSHFPYAKSHFCFSVLTTTKIALSITTSQVAAPGAPSSQ